MQTTFKSDFYRNKHEQNTFLKESNGHLYLHKRKLKTREQALGFYDELISKKKKWSDKRGNYEKLSELINNLMDYLEYCLNEDNIDGNNINNNTMISEIEKRKQEKALEYHNLVDNLYGNIYNVKVEDFESHSSEDLNLYLKISQKNRVDQLLIILDHCQCIYNQWFCVNNDLQLYKYLRLSITYGNVVENIKYLIYDNFNFKSKVLNYFIVRECKTSYNNFKKYKKLKINILNSYIESIINRLGIKKDYVNNYVIYLTQCVKYFESFGHLRNINKYETIMPKMIRLLLTRNTQRFKYQCKLNYSDILNNIGQFHDSVMLEQSLFLDQSVHPMQIFKYIQTQNEMLLLNEDQFIQYMYDKLLKGKPLPQKKFYHHLVYKFGYYNNDLLIEKYHEIQSTLKQFISQQVSNIILSPECFQSPSILKYLLSKLDIISISKSDPNYKSHLSNLYQFLLSNAYQLFHPPVPSENSSVH